MKNPVLLLLLLSSGHLFSQQWLKAVQVPQKTSAKSVIDKAGNVYLFTENTCYKFSSSLDAVGSKPFPSALQITGLQMSATDEIILCGDLKGPIQFGNSQFSHHKYYNAFFGALDTNMDLLWGRNFKGNGASRAWGLTLSDSNDIYICGNVSDTFALDAVKFRAPSAASAYVGRFSPGGQLKWMKHDSVEKAEAFSYFSGIAMNTNRELMVSGGMQFTGKQHFSTCMVSIPTPTPAYTSYGFYNIIRMDESGNCQAMQYEDKLKYCVDTYGSLTSLNYFKIRQCGFNGDVAGLAVLDNLGAPVAAVSAPSPEATDFIEPLGVIDDEAYFLFMDYRYPVWRNSANYICKVKNNELVPIAVFYGPVYHCSLHKNAAQEFYITGIFGSFVRFGTNSLISSMHAGELTYNPFIAKFTGPFLVNALPKQVNAQEAEIFPNPAVDYFEIKTAKPSDVAEITITDVMGRTQQSPAPDHVGRNSLLGWPCGIYTIKIKSHSGRTQVKRLVVSR